MNINKFNLILLLLFIPFLTYCGGFRDAFEGKKRSEQSDEFLVKKKNPLQMPPDMKKLPIPGDDLQSTNLETEKDVKGLLKIKEENTTTNSDKGSADIINKVIEKIQ